MFDSRSLVVTEWTYVTLAVCASLYWMVNICITFIAQSLAPTLPVHVGNGCPSCKVGGREAVGQLLNFLDNYVRDHQNISTTDVERLFVALSVAHLLRDENYENYRFRQTLAPLSVEALRDLKARMRSIISVTSLAACFGSVKVSRLKLFCLAVRLRQDAKEIVSLRLDEVGQSA